MNSELPVWGVLPEGGYLLGPTTQPIPSKSIVAWMSGQPTEWITAKTYLWLQAGVHAQNGTTQGCLELREGQGPYDSVQPSRLPLWSVCWPRVLERDLTYAVLNNEGELTVYSVSTNYCMNTKSTPPRTVLWTSSVGMREQRRLKVRSAPGCFCLLLTDRGQFVVVEETSLSYLSIWVDFVRRLTGIVMVSQERTTEEMTREERMRCILELYDKEKCLSLTTLTERKLLRIRHRCPVMSPHSTA